MDTPLEKLSVIIPTRNAARHLGTTLDGLRPFVGDIIVVDGGSDDDTKSIAVAKGARVIAAPPGRGGQLAAGANTTPQPWLLFLHADTRLSDNWRNTLSSFIQRENATAWAGYFRLAFDDTSAGAARVATLANWRAQTFGLPYGDQGLLISRELYDACGGYPDLALMEDVAFARRIGHKRLHMLDATAITSPTRYHRDGWWVRPMRNLLCLALYFIGAPIPWIKRVYG